VYSWQKKLAAQVAYFFCFDVARYSIYITRKPVRAFVAEKLAASASYFFGFYIF
jgi:hypothetical protein